MNKWPDDELERQMLAAEDLWPLSVSVANCACHIRALLTRVRELEKREAELTESLVEVLAGWRCLLNQQGGIVTNDSDILDRAHKALEAVR